MNGQRSEYMHTHIYTRILLTYGKKNEIVPFVTTWVDLKGIMLSEISQERQMLHHFAYVKNLKKTKEMNK